MTISKKDQKLLVYLIAVGLLAAVYFFVAKPKMEAQQAMQTEIEALTKQVNYYNEIYINQAEYEDKIAKTQVEYNETLNKFFGGLNQENTLINIKGIEEATNTWISRISFQEPQTIMGSGSEMPADESAEDDGETTEASAAGFVTGLKQDLNIDFSCKYSDFKRFIEYMQNYNQRLFVSSINTTYSIDSDLVTGSITLSQYAITGANIEYNAPDLSNITTGVENIFTTLREVPQDMNIDQISMLEGSQTEEDQDDVNNEGDENSEEELDGVQLEDNSESEEVTFVEDSGNTGRRPRTN